MPGTSSPSERVSHTFFIPALDCPEEYTLIDKGLAAVAGIEGTRPDYLGRSLHVQFNPAQIDVAAIERQLQRIGFPARLPMPVTDGSEPPVGWSGVRWLTTAAGVLLLAGGVLYWAGIRGGALRAVLIAATLTASWHVGRAAWRALRLRSIDMNVLMCIAATGAIATGDYFEAATAMFLFAVSLRLESYTLGRARRAVRSLVQLRPATAHRLCRHERPPHEQTRHEHPPHGQSSHEHPPKEWVGGEPDEHQPRATHVDSELPSCEHSHHDHVTDIDPSEICVGDLLLVRPGERIPVDGKVVAGTAYVNEAPITGESIPVEKNAGDGLYAGSLNGEGSLEMRARTTAGESTLAHVARLVEQAQAARSPTERFVDSFARRYTPAVVLIALAIAFGPPALAAAGVMWFGSVPAGEWLHRGLVLLVIACPCALVISTPVTILCGLHQATRLGLLVKGGEFLETVGRVRCVAFDKTGTLTQGRPRVIGVRGWQDTPVEEVLRIAAALETASEHPLAAAIVMAAREHGCAAQRATSVTIARGAGLEGEVDGQRCCAGSLGHVLRITGLDALPPELLGGSEGATLVVVGRERRLLGAIYLADEPRSDAQAAVTELHQLDVESLVMLTGDRQATAERIAAELGVGQVWAELLPQDKVRVVKELVARFDAVAMIGDGVNDAPALAAARVGIAFGAEASDTALETADVVSLSPHLRRIPDLIRLGRRTRDILAQNIAFALTIKLGVLLLALIGLGTLWAAVVADVGASMLVVFNGMRVLQPVVLSPRAGQGCPSVETGP